MKHENKTKIIFNTLVIHISTNNYHISDMFKDKDLLDKDNRDITNSEL